MPENGIDQANQSVDESALYFKLPRNEIKSSWYIYIFLIARNLKNELLVPLGSKTEFKIESRPEF